MSEALEPTGTAGGKRKRSEGGFVESLGREILVQARELDNAGGTKFGIHCKTSDGEVVQWISKVQQSARQLASYVVSMGNGLKRNRATFRDASNAVRCFLTLISESPNAPRAVTLCAFEDWDSRIPVLRLTLGCDRIILPNVPLATEMENRKLAAAQFDAFLSLLEDDSMTVRGSESSFL